MKLLKTVATASLMALTLATPSLAKEVTETRDVTEFTKIQIKGAIELKVVAGADQKVTVTTDDRYIHKITTEVSRGTLVIDMDDFDWDDHHDEEILVNVSMKMLRELIVDGAVDAEIENIDSEEITLTVNGAGDIEIDGKCKELEVDIRGAGDINARDLKCEMTEVNIFGAGDADVYASKEITAKLMGVGDVTVWGNPSKINRSIFGLGDFNVKN